MLSNSSNFCIDHHVLSMEGWIWPPRQRAKLVKPTPYGVTIGWTRTKKTIKAPKASKSPPNSIRMVEVRDWITGLCRE